MPRVPAVLTVLFLTACAGAHGPDAGAIRTLAQLSERCGMTSSALEALLDRSTARLRAERGIRIGRNEFAAILATSLPASPDPDCAQHAHFLTRTIVSANPRPGR